MLKEALSCNTTIQYLNLQHNLLGPEELLRHNYSIIDLQTEDSDLYNANSGFLERNKKLLMHYSTNGIFADALGEQFICFNLQPSQFLFLLKKPAMQGLRMLILRNCGLAFIPEELANLPSLVHLDMGYIST